MTAASVLLLASAALHLIAAAMTGLTGVGLFLLFPAVLYPLLAFGIYRGLRWVAWIALICMLGGATGTGVELVRASPIPPAPLWGILAVDLVCAGVLARGLFLARV